MLFAEQKLLLTVDNDTTTAAVFAVQPKQLQLKVIKAIEMMIVQLNISST
jgi:hypothetical protein